ncbi:MAG: flavin reductase family protein [Acidimicrobiales bacterium]
MSPRPQPHADDDPADRLARRVLWSLPTGLYVIGSTGEHQGRRRYNLMTANLVVQVATQPRLIAVAVETDALTAALIAAGRCFSVSVVRREDRALVRHFVKPAKQITFDDAGVPLTMAGEGVSVVGTGAPVLGRALGWIDCELHSLTPLGSHVLAIGRVRDVGADGPRTAQPLRMEDTKMSYGG